MASGGLGLEMSGMRRIIGHDAVQSYLVRSILQDKVSHAYLFVGPSGIGKSLVAREFARALNCQSPREPKSSMPLLSDVACGECQSCRKMDSQNHPDFRVIAPDGMSIKIDQVREMQSEIGYQPYEGKWKVFVIDEADKMTEPAQNSLLKVVEEPPSRSVIILLSATAGELLDTVVSRCQQVRFKRIPTAEVEEFLIGSYTVDRRVARTLAALSDGILGRAVSLATDESAAKLRHRAVDILLRLSEMDVVGLLLEASSAPPDRKEAIKYVESLMAVARDVFVAGLSQDEELFQNLDMAAEIRRAAQRYSPRKAMAFLEILDRARRDLEGNASVGLAIDAMFLDLGQAAQTPGYPGGQVRH